MTPVDVMSIVGSTATTVALMLYVLVEYPKISANFIKINNMTDKATARFVKTVACITKFAFFGSIFMFFLMLGMIIFAPETSGGLEIFLLCLSAVELIFWLPRARKLFP
ncbi:hypothetical protein GAS19_02810 [Burkholderia glumae]|uniref:hypothetical protein n=1 Tax=Burkholderia TaxID=32008 RepID=UPI001294EA8D|nr:hypothetical protein [Burkholderia glumae]QGA36711.1 hypothetical protein GAS19_02810 [Burkholderia glumae]